MNTYYIVFEKYPYKTDEIIKSWVIRNTKADMDTSEGLQQEIEKMEEEYGSMVWIINWKLLDKE